MPIQGGKFREPVEIESVEIISSNGVEPKPNSSRVGVGHDD